MKTPPLYRPAPPYDTFFDNHQELSKRHEDYFAEPPPPYDQSANLQLDESMDDDEKFYVDLANLKKNYTVWNKYIGMRIDEIGQRKINNCAIPLADKFNKFEFNECNELEQHLFTGRDDEFDNTNSNITFQNELMPIVIVPEKDCATIPKEVKTDEIMACSECACSVIGRKLKRSALFRLIIKTEEYLHPGCKLPIHEVKRLAFELSSL